MPRTGTPMISKYNFSKGVFVLGFFRSYWTLLARSIETGNEEGLEVGGWPCGKLAFEGQ